MTIDAHGNQLSETDHDGQMSVGHMTAADAAVQNAYTYDAWGVALVETETVENAYRYTGEQYDPNVGFYYLRARYYDQSTGRFSRVDPWRGSIYDPFSLHKYCYAGNDPATCVDLSGAARLPIKPSILRMARAMGWAVAIRVLVGIRATYVLGEAYTREAGSGDVSINKQIAGFSDRGCGALDWLSGFVFRPDIVDHVYQTVYEVRSAPLAWTGAADVAKYVRLLNKRYPGRAYRPGSWQPRQPSYPVYALPGIRGIGRIGLSISAVNVGGGVIAYTINPPPEYIAAAIEIALHVRLALPGMKVALATRVAAQQPITVISRGAL